MPHVDGDQFNRLAQKRRNALPQSGEIPLIPSVGEPENTQSHAVLKEKVQQQTDPHAHETAGEGRERLQGYDRAHRLGYHPEHLSGPKLTLPHQEETPHDPNPPVHTHILTTREKINFVTMRTIGNFLLFFSLYGVAATFGPALYYEGEYRIAQARGVQYTVQSSVETVSALPSSAPSPAPTIAPDSPGFGSVKASENEQVLVPPDTQFSVVIPKIGATSRVHPNVDPLDENEFLPKLQTGVAHAKGSVFPGMQGNTYLFAHSTDNFWNVGRYNAVFYLLKELKPGDDVVVFFENRRYNYKVDRTEIRDSDDVEFLVESQKPGKEQLIMQTCWPPGTTWKRLFVIATPQK